MGKGTYSKIMGIVNEFSPIEIMEDDGGGYHMIYVCCNSQKEAQRISAALEAASLDVKSVKVVTKEIISEGGRPKGTEAVVMIDLYGPF